MFTSVRPVAAKAWRAASSLPATSLGHLSSRVTLARRQFIVVSGRSSVLSSRGFATKGRPTKKAGAKKTTAKKAAPKKKKKAVAKPKPKKVRKVVTPEEKKRLEARELKKIALFTEPTRLPENAWMVHTVQGLKGQKVGTEGLGNTMRGLSETFKALSASQLENYKEIAEKNKLTNNAEYKAWVESHTPEAIHDANKARQRLKRVFKQPIKGFIQDDRQPKRAVSAYSLFTKSRWASGSWPGQKAPEVAVILAREWKSLGDAERQTYVDLAKADAERYEKDYKNILGRDKSTKSS
ncbi:putative hmg box protein [Phaeoacremonium minimum UCRPA7]|uniref:Putative hmg box protein n=1 Tax=Phaeoacremonium minimum (strain UCR-PA7) TaxID=1286976 RepID=R8BRV3_PHAM7|nr:putative hmg box protein [Phaeoacremonium minimum UCRPA7]EOO02076.1 putative hmg box protein [Phaeoacremonium minimum UCRPA7]